MIHRPLYATIILTKCNYNCKYM